MEDNKEIKKINKGFWFYLLGLIFLSFGIIYISLSIPKEKETKTTYYTYFVKRASSYSTKLKEESSSYYDNLLPNASNTYPSFAVESFFLNLTYMMEGDDYVNTEYNYNILAEIIGEYRKEDGSLEQIWNRPFPLIENRKESIQNTKSFSINENIQINYADYNNIVSAYKQTYNLSINAYLKISLNIQYKNSLTKDKTKQVEQVDKVEVRIPLNESTTKIEKKFEASTENDLSQTNSKGLNYRFMIMGLFLVLVSILLCLIAFKRKGVTVYDLYKKNMEKILKNYGDLIVTVTSKPNIKYLRIMQLEKIEDLVDVAEQNKCHIIHFEIKRRCLSYLFVINEGYVYIYRVSAKPII